MFFLLFCFLIFIGVIISTILRILFGWLRFKKSTNNQQPTTKPQKKRKRFDASNAEDVEYEEIKN